jgi:hypothetical protein
MPGYTKDELEAKRAKLANYVGCLNCRLHWHRRSFEKHFDVAPPSKAKSRPVAIIHPAWASFIDFLVDGTIKQLMEERAEKIRRGEPIDADDDAITERHVEHPTAEHEVLTVDEAVARFGVSREEILAEFEKNKIPFEVELRSGPGPSQSDG